MRNDNYPSASEVVRNLGSIRVPHRVLFAEGKFRVLQFERPYFEGTEFWVVNEEGSMWEPADSLEAAQAYLESSEAEEYQGG